MFLQFTMKQCVYNWVRDQMLLVNGPAQSFEID